MIIVNQDKDKIINFDHITEFCINNPLENNEGEFEIIAENEWTREVLGYYKTEERAKEIIKEITDFYTRADYSNTVDARVAMPIIFARLYSKYEMPEE